MGIGGLAGNKLAGLGMTGSASTFLIAWVLTFSLLGAVIVSRQPKNVFGWIFTLAGILITFNLAGSAYAKFAVNSEHAGWPAGVAIGWLAGGWNWIPITAILIIFIPLLYPTGRLLSPRWRFAVWCAVAFLLLAGIPNALMPGPLYDNPGIRNPLGLEGFGWILNGIRTVSLIPAIVGVVGAVASLFVRFSRAGGQERQQLKWFLFGVILFMIPFLLRGPVPSPIQQLLFELLLPALPISIAIAILKYRLYDIDLVINKSLVLGSLAVFITAVYVGIVVGIGSAVGSGGRPNLPLSIVATAIVAVAFEPVRERIQRIANRLVYGRRATPYEVMSDFAERVAGALSVEDVLPKMAEAAATGVGASQGRVRLFFSDGTKEEAIWPGLSKSEMDFVVPVAYLGAAIGEISVAKPAGEPLLPAERKLLTDLAVQAGLVLHNVRLTRELRQRLDEISSQAAAIRASRRRLVAARDTERRRLEQTIHGGAEAQLVGIQADLRGVEQILINDPGSAAGLLEQLTARANDTIETLRDLARGIYPPLLRERGLASALQAQAKKMEARAQISTDGLDRYPPEAEAAIYFACVEAIRLATGPAVVHVAATPGAVEFRIRASGLKLDGGRQDIEDRIQALGGSVAIHVSELSGRIPIRVLEPVG